MIIFQCHIFASDRIRIKNHEQNLGVSKNSGIPKWMEKIMEHPVKMDDLGGTHYFRKHPFGAQRKTLEN